MTDTSKYLKEVLESRGDSKKERQISVKKSIQARGIRGRTSPGRLRGIEPLLVSVASKALLRADSLVLDLGFGHSPITTRELAQFLDTTVGPRRVIGVETDALRAEKARELFEKGEFLHAGFELEDHFPEGVALIRAMNILRQYRPEEVEGAHRKWGRALKEGGYLIEGSTDKSGAVMSAHLFRRQKDQLLREGLYFYTDFTRGFAPVLFRDVLPRDLRHGIHEGHLAFEFFQTWQKCWEAVRKEKSTPKDAFLASLEQMSALGFLREYPSLAREGALLWTASTMAQHIGL